ncbi:hypothetical protein LOTGIDRAFT_142579, partial [Lottia gigantea]
QMITSKGYPEENHKVTTEDGFILTLQRIPRGRKGIYRAEKKEVVLLQHGLLGESTNFLDDLANESLAYILADSGADVWLANSRGNSYSRAHVHLKPSQEIFWNWSSDEMAQYDLPAMVDYITTKTGVSKITYIGHSQGTLIGFGGFSQNKTLASKVKLFIALAPIARLGHIKGPLHLISPLTKDLQKLEQMLGKGEFMPHSKFDVFLAKDVCHPFGRLCDTGFFLTGGFDLGNLNKSRTPVYIAHNPSGTSVRNFIHYGQVSTGCFNVELDLNHADGNFKIPFYPQPTPPIYHPEDIETPIAVFHGGHDWLSDAIDVQWLLPKLKHLVYEKLISHWMHVDFIYGVDAPKQCYKPIVQLIFNSTVTE